MFSILVPLLRKMAELNEMGSHPCPHPPYGGLCRLWICGCSVKHRTVNHLRSLTVMTNICALCMAMETTYVSSLRQPSPKHITLFKERQSLRVFRKSANPLPQHTFTQNTCPTAPPFSLQRRIPLSL